MPAKGYDILINDLNKILQSDKIYIAAVNSVLVAQKERIFIDGLASDGTKIGTYGTKPISISRKAQSRNTGRTYFKGGYREYKTLSGKGAAFVNLRNTDQLMMDLGTSVNAPSKEYAIGFNNTINGDKRDWMEEKYQKPIFETTEQEDDLFLSLIEGQLEGDRKF